MASGEWSNITDDNAAARRVLLVHPPPSTPPAMCAFTEQAAVEAAAGRLRPVIGQRLPPEQAAAAHAAIEARATVGKTLLIAR